MNEQLKSLINAMVSMPETDLELLDKITLAMQVKKGDYLLEQGQICKHVFFLKKGFFRMYYVDPKGNQINYRFTDAGNFLVDFQSFLTQKPSNYYWQAMQDAVVLAFKHDDVQTIYQQSRNWERFGRLMAEQVYQQMNARVEMMQFLTPEQRYENLLKTQPELFNKISQFHLSSYLGIKPESLSRIRKRLHNK
ncbi:Crp/Fnr family transcriptional regulator [uncultured Mucilaginibacter sp.]|uniref:Crp/Fnr family transcriptional regulator n=1 Tax=uncultured Mucilaginibacter sp. TaxID=797541 RepID=UPI002622C946|nr:Crp/Fnr family transcriptional regulator [uncultured Mucilaginibacter sp.]